MLDWVIGNWKSLAEGVAAVVGVASIIIRLTPTLKDDSIVLPVIKFIGKFIALDKYSPENRPR